MVSAFVSGRDGGDGREDRTPENPAPKGEPLVVFQAA